MKNIKLSVKIIGGFGVVLALMLLVIAIFSVSSIKTSSGYSGLLTGDVATNKHAAAIESALLQARRNEKDFILRRNQEYLSEHAQNLDELIDNAEAIKQIKSRAGDQQTVAEIERVISLANEYKENFQTLVEAQKRAGLNERSGAQGVFREAALKIAQSLPGYDVDDVIIALLQMRRYEKDYIRSEQEREQEKFVAAMDAYAAVLKQSTCEAEAKKVQEKAFKKYKRWAQEYFEAEDSVYRMEINDSLQELAATIESSLSSVRVAGAMAMLLDIRKSEKDFIINRDHAYAEQTHEAITKLRDAFLNSGILQKHIDAAVASIEEYQNAFDTMVQEYAVMEKAIVVMRDTVHQIEPVVEKIITESNQQAVTSTQEISSMAQNMSRTALFIGALTFLGGSFLSYVISRSVTVPINEIVGWMISGAEQVSAASNQVSSSSQVLADGSSEQAAAIEQTSASVEELTSMTRQNADNAAHADSLMQEASKIIKGTDQFMSEMGQSMDKIASASEDTSKIIKTIDEIAFQTNLLALNAAVEAARAGEAGAGFAVVADEVRNLALRATEAAKDTAVLIEGTIQQVNAGQEIVAKTTSGFKEVTETSTKVGSLVGEIAVASQEQSQGLSQINQAITQMDNVTQHNSASAEESAAASKELSVQAEAMMTIVRNLKSLVDGGGGRQHITGAKKVEAPKMSQQSAEAVPSPRRTPVLAGNKSDLNMEAIIPMDEDDENFEDF